LNKPIYDSLKYKLLFGKYYQNLSMILLKIYYCLVNIGFQPKPHIEQI